MMTQIPLPSILVEDLRQVEQIVVERTHSRAAVISVAGTRLLAPGSDRTRAALVLLAAYTGNYQRDLVLHAAAAVELIHAATQTHDDLVDEADRRNGRVQRGEWNHAVALMVGDYLFALAAGEMALSPDPRVISFYANAVIRITESTLAPLTTLQPLEPVRARHLERIGESHGALFGAACRAGAACVGVPPIQIDALGRFGDSLGVALRLAEEIIDFTIFEGASLRTGVVSLPLIFAVAQSDAHRLIAALDSSDPTEQAWAYEQVRHYGISPTRAEIARLTAQARVALAGVPPGEARETLARALDYAERRSYSA